MDYSGMKPSGCSTFLSLEKLIMIVVALTSLGASTVFTVFLPYCENALKLSISQGNQLFSVWLAVFFIVPVFAGYIGQKFIGAYYSITIGLLLAACGEALMSFNIVSIFYAALIFLRLVLVYILLISMLYLVSSFQRMMLQEAEALFLYMLQ